MLSLTEAGCRPFCQVKIIPSWYWRGLSTDYYLNGTKLNTQISDGNRLDFYYDDTNGLVGFGYSGSNYFYIRNHQKDITGILDSAGNQVVSYVYDSWGKLVSTSGILTDTIGVQNPYHYRGYYYDVETGFYYLQSRYYDPVTGRFINSDSLIGSTGERNTHNMFAYCGNEPINRVDPTGFAWYYPFNQYSDTGLEKKATPSPRFQTVPQRIKRPIMQLTILSPKGLPHQT